MDLSFLIPSKIRRLVLAYFVVNPDAEVGIRELARELKESPQTVYRELVNLESWGFLFSSRRGNQRAFRFNKKFVLSPPIRDLFARYRQEQNRVYTVSKVHKLSDIVQRAGKISVPEALIPGLTSRRRKPRSYSEEKTLKKFGQL